MAKTKLQKEAAIAKITSGMEESTSVVFANYQGLSVADMEELRANCREAGVTCVASKKTFVKHALSQAGLDVDTKAYQGGVVAFFGADQVSAAKVVGDFAKKNDVLSIFGGVLEGEYLDSIQVTALSKLPTKQELLGKFVGTINAPVSGFVQVLSGNLRGLVGALNAIKEQKA